ncbi:MAG: tetratricopeptide repeat protein [Firmicutes bacterium]|nr:tetratricopeptide repeat protein [Bacillota bacterium]
MSKLSYRTKGNANPQGRERVYFACHPDDFGAYFEPICADIFATQNCAIFYNSEPGTPWTEEAMELEMGRMQLIVIPVTSKFLYKPNEAREVEFAYAIAHHIPILPLMQESGIESEFNRICGDLQFLDKNASFSDATALPYAQKLERFLKSVLLGDELAEKVRGAFDAYIFLSYRKKDRKYAQELMKLIHQNDFCRDIAIWYDEFLVPGENFNDAIADAMTKSDLFTFVVTPSLLEPNNYVMTIEYPEARKAGKPILPAEMVRTDQSKLGRDFEDIPVPTDAHDAPALSEALLDNLRGIAIDENNTDPRHNFFIGLAYLGGIDVETDHNRAVGLITSAAEQNLPEAMGKLADMYKNGEGVERNYETSAQWLDRLAGYWEKRFEETGAEQEGIEFFEALKTAGKAWNDMDRLPFAREDFQKLLDLAEKMEKQFGGIVYQRKLSIAYEMLGNLMQKFHENSAAMGFHHLSLRISKQIADETNTLEARSDLALGYRNMGVICFKCNQMSDAKDAFEKSVALREQLADETGAVEYRRALSVSYNGLGDVYISEGNTAQAKALYEKGLAIREQIFGETNSLRSRRDLTVSYSNLGRICTNEGDMTGAKSWYEKSTAIREQLAEETRSVKSRDDLARSYAILGWICEKEGKKPEAKRWYMKELELREPLTAEVGTPDFYEDLAICCCNASLAENDHVECDLLLRSEAIFSALVETFPKETRYAESLQSVRVVVDYLSGDSQTD